MTETSAQVPATHPDGEGAGASMAAGSLADAPRRERRLLLLAEDNVVNAKVANAMLDRAGYRVVTVVNGVEAVEATALKQYAAVLMDCQMPQMDGYEATARIRAREGDGALRTPIIAMTAGAEPEDQRRCLRVGMDDYLVKPVLKDLLFSVLARWTGSDGGKDPGAGTVALGPPASEEVLDRDTMADLRALGGEPGSEGLLNQLFELFLDEMTASVADLHAALRREDSHAVAFIAHTVKGSAGEFGARRLVLACSDLVSMGVAGRLDGAGEVLRAVEEEYDLARHALLAECSSAESSK